MKKQIAMILRSRELRAEVVRAALRACAQAVAALLRPCKAP